jgi:hypothetical protein
LQPADGVAETMLPQRSMVSMCTVSAPITPSRATVGSPTPGARVSISPRMAESWSTQGVCPSTAPGRSVMEASPVTSTRRAAL